MHDCRVSRYRSSEHIIGISKVNDDNLGLLIRYQNSEGRSYEVTLKAGSRGYGRSGVTGSAGAYNVGARMRPQLIGCALAQEPGVLNFGLGLQTMEGDEYAETGR